MSKTNHPKPKILVNASTCVVGGGVQVAIGFITYLHQHLDEIGWEVKVVASPKVFTQCRELARKPGWDLQEITPTPAAFFSGRKSRVAIHKVIKDWRPLLCFTVFGPSYLWLNIPEICGFADPMVTNPNPYALRNHPLAKKLATHLRTWVKIIAVRRVSRFWVETSTARLGLASRLGVDSRRIEVVPNAVNTQFVPLNYAPPAGRIRFLHLSAFYYHKNHAFLVPVAQALRRLYPDLDFEFVVTLPSAESPWKELMQLAKDAGVADRFKTLGYLTVKDCPAAYAEAHVVFHPSLLEVFSATYLEAFVSRRPVVATDLDFAHEVCGDAALYFNPSSPEVAASALFRAAMDQPLRNDLINKGVIRLAAFPKANDKNRLLVSIIMEGLPRDAR